MNAPFKDDSTPNFSKPEIRQAFVEEAHTAADLLHKELDVNLAEQALLEDRIRMMNQFINDLPSSDPQYSMMLSQLQMDQVELDELKRRADTIEEQLKKR